MKILGNAIVQENALNGTLGWWTSQVNARHYLLQGFSTQISYSPSERVYFKIRTSSTALQYSIVIYRLGFYSGLGARYLGDAQISPEAAILSSNQPNCTFESWSRMVDCRDWAITASWRIASNAVTGLYIAVPCARKKCGNYIPFVVRQRDDDLRSDILFKTSDLTWQAYNLFGGWNVYRGGGEFTFASRGRKVSYNRPFYNRLPEPFGKTQNFIFSTEFPTIFWLERLGYDVSYVSCGDLEQIYSHGLLKAKRYRVFLSVGHDEYWTPELRAAYLAAREEGIHLAFLSGNEAFWRVIWEENYRNVSSAPFSPSPSSSTSTFLSARKSVKSESSIFASTETQKRVVVCQKETIDGAVVGRSPEMWTGTFVDPRFRPAEHQHALTGQHFMVNGMRRDKLQVPRRDGRLRLWRHTVLAAAAELRDTDETQIVFSSPPGLLGYEWDVYVEDCHRPNGLFTLSHTSMALEGFLMETFGASYRGNGTMTHKLTLYRHYPAIKSVSAFPVNRSSRASVLCSRKSPRVTASRSALVFGAGTVQWAWALSSFRDGEKMDEDLTIQQATLNLFADMGAFPRRAASVFQSSAQGAASLVYPTASLDLEPPRSRILAPRF